MTTTSAAEPLIRPPSDFDADTMDVDADKDDNKELQNEEASPPITALSRGDGPTTSPEMMQLYYSRLFPFSFLYSWLSYCDNNNNNSSSSTNSLNKHSLFSRREFAMTLEPTSGDEIMIRYQSYNSEQEFVSAINKRRPTKIDIGPIYSHPPKDRKAIQTSQFQPIERELVFDIDLTDYDDIRRCGCRDANICSICWTFMTMAVKCIDLTLRDDFGFSHIGWFYSGRRGVHAWVCDPAARELTDEGRGAVAKYMEVHVKTEKNKDASLPYPLHPMLTRSYAILEPFFVEYVLPASGHGLLADESGWTHLLKLLPEVAHEVKLTLSDQWHLDGEQTTAAAKWDQIKFHLQTFIKAKSKTPGVQKSAKLITPQDRQRLELWPVEIVFRYTYPRLDVEVSKKRNHLLKSPFCIHPKTGRVCVPFQASQVDRFDPFDVPTLSQLVLELDAAMVENDEDEKENDTRSNEGQQSEAYRRGNNTVPDWKKTSLKEYYEPFLKEFLDPLLKAKRRQVRDAADRGAARMGDF